MSYTHFIKSAGEIPSKLGKKEKSSTVGAMGEVRLAEFIVDGSVSRKLRNSLEEGDLTHLFAEMSQLKVLGQQLNPSAQQVAFS